MARVSGRGQQQGERADHNDCQREGYNSGTVPRRGLNNRKSNRAERNANGTVGTADCRTASGTVVLRYMPHELVGHYFVEVTQYCDRL